MPAIAQFWKYNDKVLDVSLDGGVTITAENLNEATLLAIDALFPASQETEVSLIMHQNDWDEGRYIMVKYRREWHRVVTKDIKL